MSFVRSSSAHETRIASISRVTGNCIMTMPPLHQHLPTCSADFGKTSYCEIPPDLALCNFLTFPKIKRASKGKRFDDTETIKLTAMAEFITILSSLPFDMRSNAATELHHLQPHAAMPLQSEMNLTHYWRLKLLYVYNIGQYKYNYINCLGN